MTLMETKAKRIGEKPSLPQILDWYDIWLRESDEKKVAAALEIGVNTVRERLAKHHSFQYAKELADKHRAGRNVFSGYIYDHLSPEAKTCWDALQFWLDPSNTNYEKINEILAGKTKRLKQELFIHALVSSNFDPSSACRMVGVPKEQLDHWSETDLDFRQLVEEIQWHKKNFFERSLTDLVEQRHPGATIFVNKTINADRGYGDKTIVEHMGQIDMQSNLRLEDLDLDIDTKRKILEAMRRKMVPDPVLEAKPVQAMIPETVMPERALTPYDL